MKVFFDSNIIIDVFSCREGYEDSLFLLQQVILGKIKGYLASQQLTDIHYVLRKYNLSKEKRNEMLVLLCNNFEIVPPLKSQIKQVALNSVGDFEDDLIDSIAKTNCVNYLVTSNTKHFNKSKNVIITPKELKNLLLVVNNLFKK